MPTTLIRAARHSASTFSVTLALSQSRGTRNIVTTVAPITDLAHLPNRDGYTWTVVGAPMRAVHTHSN